jgi:hypothetical protein
MSGKLTQHAALQAHDRQILKPVILRLSPDAVSTFINRSSCHYLLSTRTSLSDMYRCGPKHLQVR